VADYAARIAELEAVVVDLEAKAAAACAAGGPPVFAPTYARFRERIEAYSRWRKAMFDEGLRLLEPSDATEQQMHRRWIDHFVKVATEAFRMFKDLTLEDIPSQIAAESIASQESVAWSEVSSWELATVYGRLGVWLRTLDSNRVSLESHWSETVGLEERQDGQVAALRVQVLGMLKDSVEKVRGWAPMIEGLVNTAVGAWEGSERPSPDPSFADPVKTFVETLALTNRTLDESTSAALSIYATEKTIHAVFAEHRAETATLLQSVHPDEIKSLFADAVAAAESGAGRMNYDGQRADLRKFLDEVKDRVNPCMDTFATTFEDFVKHFDGRYTGKVNDESLELLAEAEFFDQFWRDIEDLGLPAVIQRAGEDIARLRSVDLSRVTEEHRDELRAALERNLAQVGQAIRSLDSSVLERFRLQFIDVPRAAVVDYLRGLAGYDE
jgi:hypothetical protein